MTLEALGHRHSVRSYSDRPLSDSDKAALRAAVSAVNSHEAGLHFQLVTDSPEAFAGFGRSYGFFRGVRNYIALVADTSGYSFMEEKAGYYAQMIVMKCTAMGLGTCYVGGTFSRKHLKVQLRAGWQVRAVVTVGYPSGEEPGVMARMAMKLIKRRRKAPLQFYGGDKSWEEVERKLPRMQDALKAVALAPSSLNKQPVTVRVLSKDEECGGSAARGRTDDRFLQVEAEMRRFLLSPLSSVMQPALDFGCPYRIEASVPSEGQLIDLGIAMWNFEQLFPGYWEWGNPARFIPTE